MVFKKILVLNFFFLFFVWPHLAFAKPKAPQQKNKNQEYGQGRPQAQRPLKKVFFTHEYSFLAAPVHQIKGASDKVTTLSHQLSFGSFILLNRKSWLNLSAFYEFNDYQFRDRGDFFDADPTAFDNAFSFSFQALTKVGLSKRWSLLAMASPRFSGAYGASLGDSFTMTNFVLAEYQTSKKFAFSFGAMVIGPRLEDNPLIVPIAGFRWRPNQKISLQTKGPALVFDYQFNRQLVLSNEISWEDREYRLGPGSAYPNGVYQEMQVPLKVGLKWQAKRWLMFYPFVGGYVWGQVKIENAAGQTIKKESFDPGFLGGLKIEVRH